MYLFNKRIIILLSFTIFLRVSYGSLLIESKESYYGYLAFFWKCITINNDIKKTDE